MLSGIRHQASFFRTGAAALTKMMALCGVKLSKNMYINHKNSWMFLFLVKPQRPTLHYSHENAVYSNASSIGSSVFPAMSPPWQGQLIIKITKSQSLLCDESSQLLHSLHHSN